MKTIAILTDFSERSVHAARYALHLAKKMKANVTLFSLVPDNSQKQLQPQFSVAGDDNQETDFDTNRDLESFCTKLKNELYRTSFPNSYIPEIACSPVYGEIVDVMTALVNDPDILFIVSAQYGAGPITDFIAGDDCRKIVEWAGKPLLIVPENTPIKNPEKIAFAADLGLNDIAHLKGLVNVASQLSPVIMVTHVNKTAGLATHLEGAERLLSDNIFKLIDYGRIYFRSMANRLTNNGWDWLNEHKKSDILAIVQQPQRSLIEFFNYQNTQQITYHITVPVLLLPNVI